MRKLKSDPFLKTMNAQQGPIAMNGNTSKTFTTWVNKDIRAVAETNDWSELLLKAEKQTRYFRNYFYKGGI